MVVEIGWLQAPQIIKDAKTTTTTTAWPPPPACLRLLTPSPSFLSHLGSFPFLHFSPLTHPFSISLTQSIFPGLPTSSYLLLCCPLPTFFPSLLCLLQQKNPAQTPACACLYMCECVCVSQYGRTVSEALTQSRVREKVSFFFL